MRYLVNKVSLDARRRADVVCFVNGLPLIFIELKNHDQDI
ncbi:type I restriction endonuclease, partial [Bacteroides heparinolyticus]